MKSKIGIFAGTFDPIHSGHIAFALEAARQAGLSQVVFLPERRPRTKPGIEHFGHRTAMIARAIKPYANLSLLELPDAYFDVPRTLPKLQNEFVGAELYFLMGSDSAMLLSSPSWPAKDLINYLNSGELVIALRKGDDKTELLESLAKLPVQPLKVHIINTPHNSISSSKIRLALRENQEAQGLLPSVHRYARKQWLYASPSRQ